MRIALGVRYRGTAYHGWQSQPDGRTVQDVLEKALAAFAGAPLRTTPAGRTDAGVHALQQVVHLDTALDRREESWVRGTNRHLPDDVAVQWARVVDPSFHARASARGRRYTYRLLSAPVRPSLETGLVGWTHRRLDGDAMRAAAARLLGTHDFTAFRAAECQAPSPVKTLRSVAVAGDADRDGSTRWTFDFEADAFLHHMVRNLLGSLIAVGSGDRDAAWLAGVLAGRDRSRAAPTFAAAGLCFVGPRYDAAFGIPDVAG